MIQRNFSCLLQLVASIRAGTVTVSSVVRRLSRTNKKNRLYHGVNELGRVIRTTYILEYIASVELRSVVQQATCKSEELNNFVKWAFFANKGIISENMRNEQEKIIKYNHLIANLLMLFNVDAMTKAINKLKSEGVPISSEMLTKLSPYRGQHISLLGL